MTDVTRATEVSAGPARPVSFARPARAGRAETLRFAVTHTLPAFVRGIAAPRPGLVSAFAAVGQYGWSAATLRALRARYGGAPVRIRGLSGDMLVLLDAADIAQFFAEPVDVLALDAVDKVKMLEVLEPTGVICAHGALREARREVNDHALAADRPVHPSCAEFTTVITEECAALTASGALEYAALQRVVERIGRRVVFGDRAADDEDLHRGLRRLREEANWLGMRKGRAPANGRLYGEVTARLEKYAAEAPAHTLVARALSVPAGPEFPELDPVGQAHHWMLALDTLTQIVARTLALLAAHPAEQDAARGDDTRMRACLQESLRLWPIVPDLVRVTRAETVWRGVAYPPGTHVLVPIGFHQRDPRTVPAAELFVPGRWLDREAAADTRMAPFGHGGGRCPGDRLGLLLGSALCRELLRGRRVTNTGRPLNPCRPLPGTLPPSAIHLHLTPH